MKKVLCTLNLVFVLSSLLLVSCASMKAPIINQIGSMDGFKYVYITPTSEVTSGSMEFIRGHQNAQSMRCDFRYIDQTRFRPFTSIESSVAG